MTDTRPSTPGQQNAAPGVFDVDAYDAEIERRRRRGLRIAITIGVIVAVVSFLIALASAVVSKDSRASAAPTESAARTQLSSLSVKGRAPKTGYSRSKFGRSWSDDVSVAGGHNGCNTRDDILKRDLTAISVRSDGCKVQSGSLNDPYTGSAISFMRGDRSMAVQIDHLVALSDAWQKGAQQWTVERRRDFANDPRNLQAASGTANQSKGSGDAATWLPPNKTYRCTYVSRQIAVKAAYGLWVTRAERDAMKRVLASCG